LQYVLLQAGESNFQGPKGPLPTWQATSSFVQVQCKIEARKPPKNTLKKIGLVFMNQQTLDS
jgi:hypothetical protein